MSFLAKSSTIGDGDNADERDNEESDDFTVRFDDEHNDDEELVEDRNENFDNECSEQQDDADDEFVVINSFRKERDDVDMDELNEKERDSSSSFSSAS